MKRIPIIEFITPLYQIDNKEDLGLGEVETFISRTFEDNVMNTFQGEWIKKFEKVEISFIKFGSDREGNRGGDNVIVNVSRELVDKLIESSKTTLSQYNIEFKEITDIPNGDLLITFITTSKY